MQYLWHDSFVVDNKKQAKPFVTFILYKANNEFTVLIFATMRLGGISFTWDNGEKPFATTWVRFDLKNKNHLKKFLII